MDVRRAIGGGLLRLLLFCAAVAVLRWAGVTFEAMQEEVQSTFRFSWGRWTVWIALLVAVGVLCGLACLHDRPGGYAVAVPLVTTVPALVLLAHYVVVMETAQSDGGDLPWILDHYTFYMQVPAQTALAIVAGFGLAAGLHPSARTDDPLPRQ